jgi:hypothetical protein
MKGCILLCIFDQVRAPVSLLFCVWEKIGFIFLGWKIKSVRDKMQISPVTFPRGVLRAVAATGLCS